MSPQESRILWCVLEGNSIPYNVLDIPIDANVTQLKAMINQRIKCLHDTDPDELRLWKLNEMVPINPDRTLAQRLAELGDIAVFSRELSSEEEVGELFPETPSRKHLHIVAQHPGTVLSRPSASRKRLRFETEEEAEEQICGDAPDIQTRCVAIHEAIKAMRDDLNLSDPSTFTAIPCPSLLPMPYNRFDCKKIDGIDYFEYMGRSQFHKLKKHTENRNFLIGSESLYLYGTPGSGKSYLLAALVYHLIREGKRVFYIPDCTRLLLDPAQTMWAAFHFAFYDSPILSTVNDTDNVNALIHLMATNRDVYVIIDQVNALEFTENDTWREEKDEVSCWLGALRYRHRYIFCASANKNSGREADRKQSGFVVFPIFGGMSQYETNKWFEWYGHRIPPLSDQQRQHIEYLTGCMPLLLRCLFTITDFSEHEFRNISVLRYVDSDVKKFAKTEFPFLILPQQERYLEIMIECVRGGHVPYDDRTLYDLRHFYVDAKRIGRFTCGIAFEAMVSILRKHGNPPLRYTAVSQCDNPMVQGFLAEQICLTDIAANGLMAVDSKLGPMSTTSFERVPNFTSQFHADRSVCLYIPDAYNHMSVDGVILLLDCASKQATVFSIQFTLSLNHKQSDEEFHTNLWLRWTYLIEEDCGFNVRSIFVWIDKEQPASEHEVISKCLRVGPMGVHVEYSVIHVGIKAVSPKLAYALGIQ